MGIKKSLLSENFVSTERGMMVIEGGVWLLGDIEAGFLRRCRLLLDL
jgi:hypothetical protein